MILKDILPKDVFEYFENICHIPHGSGNTDKISEYCVDFAKRHNLWYKKDEVNNVIIRKQASVGYEEHEPVILQGHLDMVCEKLPEVEINFETDPLDIRLENGYVVANGTTLGGDNGIAVAMIMAVLADDSLNHPEIYAVLTVDEETSMLGAASIDLSDVKSRILLNIDSEQEGVLTVSCAGGARCESSLKLNKISNDMHVYRISLSGLTGGHSGVEIHKNRLNANVVISNLLLRLVSKTEILLVDMCGGTKDNAITRECECVIATNSNIDEIISICDEFTAEINKITDPEFSLSVIEDSSDYAFDATSTQNAVKLLNSYPYGVIKMSENIDGLVETSLNFGTVRITDDILKVVHSVRSSKNAEKFNLLSRLENLTRNHNGSVEISGQYPAWEFKEDSKLRDIMVSVYDKLYGDKPVVEAIHAGLECGMLSEKLPGLDAVSFGPNILDIHTPDERLDVKSVERTYKYLCEILKEI